MKYRIIPKNLEDFDITIEGESTEDAMANFAAAMNSDMNEYFQAVTEERYLEIHQNMIAKHHKQFVKNWMAGIFVDDYGIDEESAKNLATMAYDKYSSGKLDLTEYGCIEATYDEEKKEQLDALESKVSCLKRSKDFSGKIVKNGNIIEIRERIEDSDESYLRDTADGSCVTQDDIEDLCNENSWF